MTQDLREHPEEDDAYGESYRDVQLTFGCESSQQLRNEDGRRSSTVLDHLPALLLSNAY